MYSLTQAEASVETSLVEQAEHTVVPVESSHVVQSAINVPQAEITVQTTT